MRSIVLSVEDARVSARLSQEVLARELGISQGHYSKVLSGRVTLTLKLEERMRDWVARRGSGATTEDSTLRMYKLAASIRRECMELMQLMVLAKGLDDVSPGEGV